MSDEKHPLELKFEEVARKPPVRQRETSETLNEIVIHEGMMKLFHLMESSPKLIIALGQSAARWFFQFHHLYEIVGNKETIPPLLLLPA